MRLSILVLVACVMVAPFLLMVDGSLQTLRGFGANVGSVIQVIPDRVTLANYRTILTLQYLPMMVLNTGIMMVGYIVGCIVVNGLVAYAMSFYRFAWKKAAFVAAMATMFVPASTVFIPRYIVVRNAGLSGIPAVLVMVIFDAGTIFMFRSYFDTIPQSLIEIARMDGARDWTIFRRIVAPLSAPIIAAAVVFRAVAALGDFLWQTINLQAEWEQTLIIGLYNSIQYRGGVSYAYTKVVDFGYSLSIGVVLMLPVLLIFAFTSKYFVGGLTLGAVKD